MEKYWDEGCGFYSSPVQESSLTNAMMVQTFSILAGANLLEDGYRRRCADLVRALTYPPVTDGAGGVSLYMSAHAEPHISVSGPYCTALACAWRHAGALGLDEAALVGLEAGVTAQVEYLRNELSANRTGASQTALRWGPEAAAAAYAITGDEHYRVAAREFLDEFFHYYSTPAPGHARPFVNGDWTWIYDSLSERASSGVRSEYDFTYLSHCAAGAWFFQSMGGRFSADETAVVNALLRTSLAHWTIGGYPQWISSQLDQRSFSTNYWSWCFYSLAAMAAWEGWDDEQRGVSRAVFDNAGGLFDRWLLADRVVRDDGRVANPYGVKLAETPSLNRHADFAIAMYAAYLALAAEIGVADVAPAADPRVWNYEFETTNLYASTRAYGFASGNEILKAFYEPRGDITLLFHGNGRLLSPAYTESALPPPQWSLCVTTASGEAAAALCSDQRRPDEMFVQVDGRPVEGRPYDATPWPAAFQQVSKLSRWFTTEFDATVTLTAMPDHIVRSVEIVPHNAPRLDCYTVFPSRAECRRIEILRAAGSASPLQRGAHLAVGDVAGWHFSFGGYGYAVILLNLDPPAAALRYEVFSPPPWDWDAGRGDCVRLQLAGGEERRTPLTLRHAIVFTDGSTAGALAAVGRFGSTMAR
ncbi:hypothetical protein RAS1_23230 [Phycisphaerae bacterium RAS1]|nr:hypothetical protein RAS1_23230 [Phycisphaerae bacterium RAS1]